MSSQTLFALHAIANALITLFSVGLFWHAWKTDQKSKMTLKKITEKIMIDKIGAMLGSKPDISSQSDEYNDLDKTHQRVKEELRNHSSYQKYLKSQDQKNEPAVTFPEWMEMRKEAHHG